MAIDSCRIMVALTGGCHVFSSEEVRKSRLPADRRKPPGRRTFETTRYDREAIVASLRDQLKRGDKSLVGNRGFRKYLKQAKSKFDIDEKKIEEEARYDGKWVLRTNTDLPAADVALKYKQLWMTASDSCCEAKPKAPAAECSPRPASHCPQPSSKSRLHNHARLSRPQPPSLGPRPNLMRASCFATVS